MKLHLVQLLFVAILILPCFQSCDQPKTSETTENDTNVSDVETKDETETIPETKDKLHSEMTTQEYSDFVAEHAEHLTYVDKKFVEIKNEFVKKKDQFTYECESGKINLERLYNDDGAIHLLTITNCKDNDCSTKHHFFVDDKLIYQFYHHVVKEGNSYAVDDHRTFFKEGEMLKCLENRYSYKNGEAEPNVPYRLVDCTPDQKLTKDVEKLLTSSEEEAKAILCK